VSKASSNRGERGVHVAVDEHQVGPNLGPDRLEPLHHGGGLRRLGARPDPEVVVGAGIQSSSKNVSDMLESYGCPVCTMTCSMPGRLASSRSTGASFVKFGRASTTERIRFTETTA